MKDIKVAAKYSDSGEKAGILKRIFDAKEKIGNTTIISYGDTYAQINFSELIHSHRNSKFILTLVVAPMVNPFGIVEWNLDNCVTNFIEKPILNHYIGYMIINKRIFDYINEDIINLPDGQGIDLLKDVPNEVPTIMLTARTDLIDKVLGLESGESPMRR